MAQMSNGPPPQTSKASDAAEHTKYICSRPRPSLLKCFRHPTVGLGCVPALKVKKLRKPHSTKQTDTAGEHIEVEYFPPNLLFFLTLKHHFKEFKVCTALNQG